MLTLAMAVGVALILVGMLGAASPQRLLSVVDWKSWSGLYIAAAIRVVTGLVLILAAPASKSPAGFRFIGTIALIAGFVLSLIPTRRWEMIVWWWWTKEHRTLYRAASTVVILLGAFIVYAALPLRAAAH